MGFECFIDYIVLFWTSSIKAFAKLITVIVPKQFCLTYQILISNIPLHNFSVWQKFHRLMEKEVEARKQLNEKLCACQKELDTSKADYEEKLLVLQRDIMRLETEKQEVRKSCFITWS